MATDTFGEKRSILSELSRLINTAGTRRTSVTGAPWGAACIQLVHTLFVRKIFARIDFEFMPGIGGLEQTSDAVGLRLMPELLDLLFIFHRDLLHVNEELLEIVCNPAHVAEEGHGAVEQVEELAIIDQDVSGRPNRRRVISVSGDLDIVHRHLDRPTIAFRCRAAIGRRWRLGPEKSRTGWAGEGASS